MRYSQICFSQKCKRSPVTKRWNDLNFVFFSLFLFFSFRLFLILDLLDWSTIVAGPQHLRVRTGSKATGTNYTIWLLILVALVLLIIVLCIICQGTRNLIFGGFW